MREEVLRVENLCKSFVVEKSIGSKIKHFFSNDKPECVKALNNVSFDIKEGEILGILGESGSGKSTLARVLMGIHKPDSGSAFLLGTNIFNAVGKNKTMIQQNMQMVFQDPFGSLDPRMNVRQILAEPLKIHNIEPKEGLEPFLKKGLKEVGLSEDSLNRYPSEFSGGQRQRIGICRALILNPRLIIADEAVSALDVSVQAQILELLIELKQKRRLSMIFISHDVAVVRQISDRIILLYHGEIVEELPADKLLTDARHEYSQKLLGAALSLREGASNHLTSNLLTQKIE